MPDFALHRSPRVTRTPGLGEDPRDAPRRFHRSMPGYAPSPLADSPELARRMGVGSVLIKNEQTRLGLPSFKILGSSWGIHRTLCERLDLDPGISFEELRRAAGPLRDHLLTCATDGNHGRAVAHMARLLGLRSRIYVPVDVSASRAAAIESEGAEVVRVFAGYDDAVRYAAVQADRDPHAILVSDTAWPGYETVPRRVIEGYSTIFLELDEQLVERGLDPEAAVDLVIVPAGVGAFAAAVCLHFGPRPATRVATVEPDSADCVHRSLRAGVRTTVPGPHYSIMAGLNCGETSVVAWPILLGTVGASITVDDRAAREAMRIFAESGVESGESGAASLAGALLVSEDSGIRAELGLTPESTILLLNTEGASDRESYRHIVGALSTVTDHPDTARLFAG
ncbi:diaminopropionate ammonia-lyase [Spongiactinospora sp. TRM90649]|uniref:diaminopropionate ammonia-lyase n=1 Tax=Spongiactinospora sp. TRM90649 TaxID=3031114 RepID=UPI0023F9D934|nr:diaminopropionate ammonia-lyase [Spongiactinospora sp. TRM90649]MDF5751080.1 diaminopropionate ammonia-lyase [Spongiactinospora sp. TRM90649]